MDVGRGMLVNCFSEALGGLEEALGARCRMTLVCY